MLPQRVNSLRPIQNGRQFPDDIFECIFLTENVIISIKISLKFVPKGSINNIPTLVQIMAWRRPGDKPLSEPMTVRLSTHICVTRPQWVNPLHYKLLLFIVMLTCKSSITYIFTLIKIINFPFSPACIHKSYPQVYNDKISTKFIP